MPGRKLHPQSLYRSTGENQHVHDTAARATPKVRRGASHSTVEEERTEVDPDDLLSVLEDDIGRRVLEQIAEEAKPARALVDAVDASRATVYRRLSNLEDAGLVETSMQYDEDGHHRKVFQATLERITLELDGGDLRALVSTSADAAGGGGRPTPR
jgi:DNA-binding transcriptional ArsR family regulator